MRDEIEIRVATRADVPRILTLFDGAVGWLVERGISGQWGTRPFSDHSHAEERFLAWIDPGVMFVAQIDGEIVGSLAISEHPPAYAEAACVGLPGPVYYLEAFVTDRSRAGQGIGRTMLAWAERRARDRGIGSLQLDCWSGNPALVAYYQRAGYVPVRRFEVGTWIGQLLVKELR